VTIDELLALPKGHKTLRRYLEWGILYEASYIRKRERISAKRGDRIYTQPSVTTEEINNKIMAAVRSYEVSLFEKWLVEGIPLGSCTPAMLRNAAKHEETRAEGHVLNAKFYRAIAAKGEKDKPIRETIGIDQIESIRVRTFNIREPA
jgi:hypothetical protein